MNPKVTSKEELIEISKQIVKEEGINALNIRSLSKRCGIASGSVYNYFSSKEGLMLCIVESIWDEIFDFNTLNSKKNTVLLVEAMLNAIESGKKSYPDFIAIHYLNFNKENLNQDKNKMLLYFEKIKKLLKSSLLSGNARTLGKNIDLNGFVDILFNLIISQFFMSIDKKSIIGIVKIFIGE